MAGAAGATPMQMGNGPQGGQSGVYMPPSNGGAIGAGGVVGSAGMLGAGGFMGSAGNFGSAGMFGAGGTLGAGGVFGGSGMFGSGGTMGMGGSQMGMAGSAAGMTGIGGTSGGNPEMGRLVGMTAAHNAVRAAVMTTPPLQPMVWSDKLAQYAQQWTDTLAMTSCSSPHHRSQQDLESVGYGENLAAFTSSFGQSTAQQAVDGWAGEKTCWTYGAFMLTDKCDTTCYQNMHSDGCGHYTQIVWRGSMQVGCGVSTCMSGFGNEDIWICNYAPAGNYVGQTPY
jgi:pathogenesis-related protein 1